MTPTEMTGAVLAANLLTAMCIYGFIQFSKREEKGEFDWVAYACIGFPLAIALGTALIAH